MGAKHQMMTASIIWASGGMVDATALGAVGLCCKGSIPFLPTSNF